MLRELDLLPVYDSAEVDLMDDLIIPLLQQSQQYWRGVGFFTSGLVSVLAFFEELGITLFAGLVGR